MSAQDDAGPNAAEREATEERLPFYPLETENDDEALRLFRAQKFRALAALFRLEIEDYPAAVSKLLETCPGVLECPVAHGAVRGAGESALEWASAAADDLSVNDEHIRFRQDLETPLSDGDTVYVMPIIMGG